MKIKILAVSLILFVSCMIAGQAAYSQEKPRGEKPSPEKMAKRMADLLDKELELSDSQYDQVYDLVKSYAESHTRETFDRDEINSQIKSVLNNEQQSKFDEVIQNMPPPGSRNR